MPSDILQIEKESYQHLVENVRDFAIFMTDVSGYIISWNKGAEFVKGYTAAEIIGKHISVFYTPEQIAEGVPQMDLQITLEKGQFEDEAWRIRKNGTRFWAHVVFTLLKDSLGNTVGVGKVTRDITRRKKVEDENRRLNDKLKDQLQKSRSEILDYKHALDESSIVAITDQKGIIHHVNDNFCAISKYSREELIGQDHRIINSKYHPKEFIHDLWTTIAKGKIWRGELKNKAKDGTFYWVDTTIVPFLNEKGKPYQYLAIRSDITKRKLAEEQIHEINEDLERKIRERTLELTKSLEREMSLNEMKSRFVSMASHEFRTPLTAILSSISLIERYKMPDQEEKRHKHVERIKSSIRNLTDILDDFLSLDKLEQGKIETQCLHFDLQEFIEDTINQMEGMLKKKNQEILLIYNGPREIKQDKKILRNVLLNLLSNAVKYSPEGKIIQVQVNGDNENVFIAIKDEGIGIPFEAQQHLFSKFFRAGNAVNIQGTGLGLNIVQKYVELLDGNISFSSEENQGSVFTVGFPKEGKG
ncbi:MAG: PAS domain-containing sensor histidine kinase [Bacteroidota bacterium]|nr:PAS domain-containing sensor histidine kinase [Bacteroidota bacterium]